MTKFFLIFLLVGSILISPAKAMQSPPLPADLLFVTGETDDARSWISSEHNMIARVDAATLETTLFYID
jgi:hypothetical protein